MCFIVCNQQNVIYLQIDALIKEKRMKRIFLLFIVLALTVSCLDGGVMNTSYPAYATFEYGAASFNSDSLCVNKDQKIGMGWDLLVFHHKLEDNTGKFQGGFIVSKLAVPESGVTARLSNNEYRVNAKVNKMYPNSFAVFAQTPDMPDAHLIFAFKPSNGVKGTCSLKSVMVNNTVAVADAVNKTFKDGDVLSLKVTGYLAGKKTDEAEIKLAEFTAAKDSVVSSWTLLDLSKLGMVDSVRFAILPPPEKPVPETVCIDDLLGNITIASE